MRSANAKWPVANQVNRADASVPHVGWVVDVTPDGEVWVDYAGNESGAMTARCATGVLANVWPAAEGGTVAVVLVFEQGDPALPIVLAALGPALAAPAMQTLSLSGSSGTRADDCLIDGERLVLEGRKEVVLRCGECAITLKADGKIVLKGREIVSRAFEANKIKGACVNIN